jgi:hypothetical protein
MLMIFICFLIFPEAAELDFLPLFFEEDSAEFWNVIFSLFPLYLQLRKAAIFSLSF